MDSSFAEHAYLRGRKIFVWTVNHLDDMKRVVDMGIHGIFSDRPDILIEQLKKS